MKRDLPEALQLEIDSLASRYLDQHATVAEGIDRMDEAARRLDARSRSLESYRQWLEAVHPHRDHELTPNWSLGDLDRAPESLPINEEIDRLFQASAAFATLGEYPPNLPHRRGLVRWVSESVGRMVLSLARIFAPHQTRFNHRSLLLIDALRRETERLRQEVLELRHERAVAALERTERDAEAKLRQSGFEETLHHVAEQQILLRDHVAELQESVDELPLPTRDSAVGHRQINTDLGAIRGLLENLGSDEGSPQEAAERRADRYLPLLAEVLLSEPWARRLGHSERWPVLDLGASDEWTDVLGSAGLLARGLSIPEGLASHADVSAVLWPALDQIGADSARAMTAFRIVEHLPLESTIRLLEDSLRILRPGGLLIIETTNPAHPSVFLQGAGQSKSSLSPQALELLSREVGFDDVRSVVVDEASVAARRSIQEHTVPGADSALAWLEQSLSQPRVYALIARAPSVETEPLT